MLGVLSADLGRERETLVELSRGRPLPAGSITEASNLLAQTHLSSFRQLAEECGSPDLIAVHGQTVFHAPPHSWQLINPWLIATVFDVPVVSDLRGRDLAGNGEGAPITPLSDHIWFGQAGLRQVVLNLGGFANATLLPGEDAQSGIEGFDICACNHVLNAAARRALDRPFDDGGSVAARGVADEPLNARLVDLLAEQAASGRSLGSQRDLMTDVFASTELSPEDLLATATHAVAAAIGERLKGLRPERLVIAGGGARNSTLLRAIENLSGCGVVVSDELGMPVEAREAAAIATLGAVAADGGSITLPAVTGRQQGGSHIDGLWCLPKRIADADGVWRPR